MDFLERFFHVSPDGGSGSTEAMYLIALAVLAALAFLEPVRRAMVTVLIQIRADRIKAGSNKGA